MKFHEINAGDSYCSGFQYCGIADLGVRGREPAAGACEEGLKIQGSGDASARGGVAY